MANKKVVVSIGIILAGLMMVFASGTNAKTLYIGGTMALTGGLFGCALVIVRGNPDLGCIVAFDCQVRKQVLHFHRELRNPAFRLHAEFLRRCIEDGK